MAKLRPLRRDLIGGAANYELLASEGKTNNLQKKMLRFFLSWSILLFIGCSLSGCYVDSAICPDCESDPGIIISFEAGPSGDCESLQYRQTDNFVIQDDSSYQAILSTTANSYNGCDSLSLKAVDFDQHSVMSMAVSGSGCSRTFCVTVEDDPTTRQYNFISRVVECGGCEPLEVVRFWVVVPKIPDDYSVSFSTVRDQF